MSKEDKRSKIVTLNRKDVNRLIDQVTFSEFRRGVLTCPGCWAEHTQREVWDGVRKHKRGCWVQRVIKALEYDYE